MEPWTGVDNPALDLIIKWVIFICLIVGAAFVIFGLLFRSVPKSKDKDKEED